MKKMMNTKSHPITMKDFHLLIFTLVSLILIIVPVTALAQELAKFEGTIQGLNCVHFQQKCPEKDLDMYIALEHDFVLLLSDGSHFVLPNLDRGIKARYLTKEVRIRGEQKGTTIRVENFEVKKGNQYRLVSNFQEQQKLEQAP